MNLILGIWIFYRKLIVPTLLLSVLICFVGGLIGGSYSLKWFGFSYMILTPLFQYFIYEIRNKNEYFFYYNLGLSKPILWASSISISLVFGLILIIV